jgi:hypothetical protein
VILAERLKVYVLRSKVYVLRVGVLFVIAGMPQYCAPISRPILVGIVGKLARQILLDMSSYPLRPGPCRHGRNCIRVGQLMPAGWVAPPPPLQTLPPLPPPLLPDPPTPSPSLRPAPPFSAAQFYQVSGIPSCKGGGARQRKYRRG